MDRRAMIGHLAAKFDVKLNENDPALLMVEMCRFMMESVLDSTGQEWEGRMVDANEKLTLAIGAMAGAITEMNLSADNLVERKLIDLNNHVNEMVGVTIKNTIEQSLNAAVAKEIQAIRKEVGVIRGSLEAMHRKSGRSQILAGAGAGALAALLTLSVAWWAVGSGKLPIDVRVDSPSVAQTVLAGVKDLLKTR